MYTSSFLIVKWYYLLKRFIILCHICVTCRMVGSNHLSNKFYYFQIFIGIGNLHKFPEFYQEGPDFKGNRMTDVDKLDWRQQYHIWQEGTQYSANDASHEKIDVFLFFYVNKRWGLFRHLLWIRVFFSESYPDPMNPDSFYPWMNAPGFPLRGACSPINICISVLRFDGQNEPVIEYVWEAHYPPCDCRQNCYYQNPTSFIIILWYQNNIYTLEPLK